MPTLHEDDVWTPEVIPRQEFCEYYFDYKPGQHVVFAGPTQRAGKTTLSFQLLEYVATPEMPAYIAVSKPRDPVTEAEMKRLDYRLVKTWPVEPRVKDLWGGQKPSGYVIWPEFGDIDTDVDRAAQVISALLRDRYAQGVKNKQGILVMDDTVVKSKLLGLDKYMKTHIAMAGAMNLGGWYFVQKPTGSGEAAVWAYGNSEHLFVSRDPDKRNRIRYDEIGGFESHQIDEISNRLESYQFLYLKRTGGHMCIVDSK
jgi:hypothetical protein